MELKIRNLAGDTCSVAVYDGRMRFLVTGCLYRPSQSAIAALNKMGYGVKLYPDHSADFTIQYMIPWDMPNDALEEAYEEALNRMEALSGGFQVCSSAWNAGHDSADWDWAMSKADQALIKEE